MNVIQSASTALVVIASTLTVSGCGGASGAASTPSAGTSVVVAPSLGKFTSGAHVTLKKPDGTVLGTADTTSAGTATISIGSYSGPLVIDVTGAIGVQYYDEGSGSSKPFGSSDTLQAIAPAVQSALGVTAATHAAVQQLKSSNGGSIPSAITNTAIQTANAKMAAALGIADILQSPKLVDASTSQTLDVSTTADKYALQLAALAKLAATGKSALDVAKDLAADLVDGKLDGQVNGIPLQNRSTTYTAASVADDVANNLKVMATALGTTNTANLVNNNPAVVGTVIPDVTSVQAATPAIVLAKSMMSELRTTFSSYANNTKTGFLDSQFKAIDAEMKASIGPSTEKLAMRLEAIGMALKVYDAAYSGIPSNGAYPGALYPNLAAGTWSYVDGSVGMIAQSGGAREFQYCSTTGASSAVTCFVSGGTDAIYIDPNTNPNYNLLFTKIVVSPTATPNQFSYVATLEQRTYDYVTQVLGSAIDISACTGGCSGFITRTMSANAPTGYAVVGKFPRSKLGNGIDNVNISAAKTALATPNNYRYILMGSASATDAQGSNPVSYSFDSGSQFDLDETYASTTGSQLVAATIIGTVQTATSKYTGSAQMSGITTDKSGTSKIASNTVFNGTVTDTSAGGAGNFLTGKFETNVTGYSNYDATQLRSATNYIHGVATFNGSIQAPGRPLMQLQVSGTETGPLTTSVTTSYSYGTVVITGTGTSSPTSSTFTMSNQDGIQISRNPADASQTILTKAGVTLATIWNNVINYTDGTSESLN